MLAKNKRNICKNQKEEINIVVKNTLLTSKYDLAIGEKVLLYCILSQLNQKTPITPGQEFKVTLHQFIEARDIDRTWGFRQLREACNTFLDRKYFYKYRNEANRIVEVKGHFVDKIEYCEEDNYVSVVFSNTILEYLSDLKDNYTTLKFKEVCLPKTANALRIFELLSANRYKGLTGKYIISLEDLQYMLCTSYEFYANFKQKVLNPVINELTDKSILKISFKEIKEGRKVVAIMFLYQFTLP